MDFPPISLVTPWYGHFAGGAEVAARSYAEQLARRGFDIEVLTTCAKSPYESWWKDAISSGTERIAGVTLRRFPVNPDGEKQFHELNARLVRGLSLDLSQQHRFLRATINSDALVDHARHHATGRLIVALPYTQGLIHAVVAALPGKVWLMPCLHDEAQARWETTAQMFDQAAGWFFLSEEEKGIAIRLFGRRLGRRLVESPVVGIGVELSKEAQGRLGRTDSAGAVRRKYRLPERYLVYVGRKDVGKNVQEVVRLMTELRDAEGAEELLFLGGGDPTLVPARPGFRDLGFVSEEDKTLVVSQAMALVNLSRNESFSLVVLEAWLAGTPVIVSARSPVTSAHCRRAGGGIVIGDSAGFMTAVARLRDEGTRARLVAAGRRYVMRHYAWDAVLDRLVLGAAA